MSGLGNSLAWSKRGDLLVGNAMARSAGLYPVDVTADGGRVLAAPIFLPNPNPGMTGQDFGRVVSIGDVTTDVDEEFIVAAPAVGRVYVFSGTGLVDTIVGGPSFGASLAIEPASFGGLHALWIGEPSADTVHRYFADQLTSFPAPADGLNTRFGASIAVDQRNVVAIGAPEFDDGLLLGCGAVFEAVFDAGTRGQAQQCALGRACALPGCTSGACVSGVYCQQVNPPGSDCAMGERCVNDVCVPGLDASVPSDAGTPDAGAPDAGEADAGETDAGSGDAGTSDLMRARPTPGSPPVWTPASTEG